MSQWVSADKIEYIRRIEIATAKSENPNLDLSVMDYLGTIIGAIDEQDIMSLGQRGIININYKMTTEEGERKNDDVIIANDGEYLTIIQAINLLEEAQNKKREKDELQIGIILNKIGRIEDITVLEQERRFGFGQIAFYAGILERAQEIKTIQKEKEATGIRKIFYGLKNFLIEEGRTLQSMKPILINKIINIAKSTVGEETQEIYREKKEKNMRKSAITHKVTPWAERLIAELSMTEEKRKQIEEEAQRRRSEITMTHYENNEGQGR